MLIGRARGETHFSVHAAYMTHKTGTYRIQQNITENHGKNYFDQKWSGVSSLWVLQVFDIAGRISMIFLNDLAIGQPCLASANTLLKCLIFMFCPISKRRT